MIAWITANWLTITIAAAALIAVCNAATRHWSTHTGFVRGLLFVSEVLSILTSRGSTLVGPLKPPLVSVRPKPLDPKGPRITLLLLLLVSLIGACAGWQATTKKSLTIAQDVLVSAHVAANRACKPAVARCRAEKQRNPCEYLEDCIRKRKPVYPALLSAQSLLSVAYRAVDMGGKVEALKLVGLALDAAKAVCVVLRSIDVPVAACAAVGLPSAEVTR